MVQSLLKGKELHKFQPYTRIDTQEVMQIANGFADSIEQKRDELEELLLSYESYEVVQDEIGRTLDLLRNLSENELYFKLRVGEITTFLPRNQPLYAFSCFVVIPALMSSSVHFRIPNATKFFFGKVLELLEIKKQFPNIIISNKQRLEFLKERSALRIDPKTGLSHPVTDAVIFTGTSHHASQLRRVFSDRVLFISNGSGHNPVVVAGDSNISKAVDAVIALQFYNQGQDCAAPNAILVHESIFDIFLNRLYKSICELRVGNYTDKTCRIGPISNSDDLVRIQNFLCENYEWIYHLTPGVIETGSALVHPTLIIKPLRQGGNYSEIFAPIVFVQKYTNDAELENYFESKYYVENAMYVTLYGTSNYIEKLIDKNVYGRIIHKKDTFLHNTHLHANGVERGVCPYGGYGYGASSISINGSIIPLPTLPQRDIYEYVARPMMEKIASGDFFSIDHYSEIKEKNIKKILQLPFKNQEESQNIFSAGEVYIDIYRRNDDTKRYVLIEEKNIYRLLEHPNISLLTSFNDTKKQEIIHLKKLVEGRDTISEELFTKTLYAIPKKRISSDEENREYQKQFFSTVYQLLFGKETGPKLTTFLYEANKDSIMGLLDVE